MAWYDKNKVPEWKIFVEKSYSVEGLLNNKDMILQELIKVEEIQQYIKKYRNAIVTDCLQLCLEYPLENSTYDRKYSYPTKAIELMTCDLFFSSLSWDKQLIQKYVNLIFKHFSTVNPHVENVNLYHAYFQRLFRALFGCRVADKLDVMAAIEEEVAKNSIMEQLFKHSYKLSISCCLEIMLTVDFLEPLITVSIEIKKSIVDYIYSILDMYLQKSLEVERAQNCLQMLKVFFEKAINFLASINRNELSQSPINTLKIQQFFEIYSIFQSKFSILINLLTKISENSIKILIFQLLQLNQIMLSQPQLRRKEIPAQWCLKQCEELITHTLSNRVNISYPFFIDWLTITFSEIGRYEYQIEAFCRLNILESVIQLILSNKFNNILTAKIYQFLKIIFHNIAEVQVITCIEKYKSVNINLITFKLLNYYLNNLPAVQAAIKQFRSINDPLFVTLFNLYKIISQYCKTLDTIFNLYIHIDICKQTKPIIARIIEFQRQQPCFAVYEREISKDLGRFYTDEMFLNQKPLQFTVKPLSQPSLQQPQQINQITLPVMDLQTVIQMPSTTAPLSPLISQAVSQKVVEQAIEIPKQIKITFVTKSETTIPQPIQNPGINNVCLQQQDNEEDNPNRYGTYMRDRLKQVETNLNLRRSQSRTPTKIKNQLKKAKNRWVNTQDEPQKEIKKPFSCDIKEKTTKSLSSPKLTKMLLQCNIQKIALIKISKNRKPLIQKERLIVPQRDGRLIGWLKALRS